MNAASDPRTINDALRAASAQLARAGIETPRLDAEVLLRHVLGVDRTRLFLRLGEPLSIEAEQRFLALVDERMRREPVAYLVGEREFMGLPFAVGRGVLVPRPETEILVEWALRFLARRPPGVVLDIGTGSGAIALSLAEHLDNNWNGRIVGADASVVALDYASRNRSALDLNGTVSLVRGDLATWCSGPVDLLLANLPYLRPEQFFASPDLAAEPADALVSGSDGLVLIRRLVADAPRIMSRDGAIGLEIDPEQAEVVLRLGRETLPHLSWSILPDLAGLARHVIGSPG